jgi:hypothetical protein
LAAAAGICFVAGWVCLINVCSHDFLREGADTPSARALMKPLMLIGEIPRRMGFSGPGYTLIALGIPMGIVAAVAYGLLSVRERRTSRLTIGPRTFCLVGIFGVGLVGFAGLCVMQSYRFDRSNYTVDAEVTRRVTELFDELGHRKGELLFGGGSMGAAVGSSGMSGVVLHFDLANGKGALGMHCLRDRKKEVIRFSLSDPKITLPFKTTVLSASLTEDPWLLQSFESLVKRLEVSDPYARHWFVDYAAPHAR